MAVLVSERGMILVVTMILLAAVLILVMAAVVFGYYSMQYSFYRQQYITAMMRSEQGINRGLSYLTTGDPKSPPTVTIPPQPSTTALKNYVINTAAGTTENNYKIVRDDQMHLYGVGYAGNNNMYERVVQIGITETSLGIPPSALYIDSTNIVTTFAGNSFYITGNDTLPNGSPGSYPSVDGVSTSSDADTAEFISGLSKQQQNNITGVKPQPPDVVTATTFIDVLALFNALAGAADYRLSGTATAGGTYGTPSAPAITYWSTDATIGGNFSGAGALVVNGNITFKGNFTWVGLVITTGSLITQSGGNPVVYGAVLVKTPGGSTFTMKGNDAIYYDQEALDMFKNLFSFKKGSWVELK